MTFRQAMVFALVVAFAFGDNDRPGGELVAHHVDHQAAPAPLLGLAMARNSSQLKSQ